LHKNKKELTDDLRATNFELKTCKDEKSVLESKIIKLEHALNNQKEQNQKLTSMIAKTDKFLIVKFKEIEVLKANAASLNDQLLKSEQVHKTIAENLNIRLAMEVNKNLRSTVSLNKFLI
jgi:predicted nuclease with TOPRIM domain